MLMVIGMLTIGLTSCNKDKLTDNAETAAAENFNIAEIEDDNTQIMADQAESESEVNLRTSGTTYNSTIDLITGCAVVTKDTLSVPKKITIDFGTGCTNANGVTRKGKIIITFTGQYRAAGTIVHIVSENYYVNANKVDIDRTVTNEGPNDNGNLVYAVHAIRTISFPDGTSSSSTINKTREWIAGYSTPREFSDDVYRVSGSGTHISRRGIIYDATTLTPLIRKVMCHQFVSGEVKIIRNTERNRFGILNFGTGECDNEATVTLDNGRTYTIDLRH